MLSNGLTTRWAKLYGFVTCIAKQFWITVLFSPLAHFVSITVFFSNQAGLNLHLPISDDFY